MPLLLLYLGPIRALVELGDAQDRNSRGRMVHHIRCQRLLDFLVALELVLPGHNNSRGYRRTLLDEQGTTRRTLEHD